MALLKSIANTAEGIKVAIPAVVKRIAPRILFFFFLETTKMILDAARANPPNTKEVGFVSVPV